MGPLDETAENVSPKKKKLCPPPRPLAPWRKYGPWIFYAASIVGFAFICSRGLPSEYSLLSECLAHIVLLLILLVVILQHWWGYDCAVHKKRLEDCSVVESTIVEARTATQRLKKPERPEDYADRYKELQDEADRLKSLGKDSWTEYQVLSLNQMLVDFLDIDDLKERALSGLTDLEEYAIDPYNPLEIKTYDRWEWRVNRKIVEIEKTRAVSSGENADLAEDDAAEPLRAALRMLLEHVAGYEKYWGEGSAYLRILITCAAVAIPVFILMGLVPLWHPYVDQRLDWMQWAFLGTAGALTAVLLDYRKSNAVDVGVTQGRKELWRGVTGSVLGSVAGLLFYSMVVGGLLKGSLFPDFETSSLPNIGRSFFWAMSSGFTFEKIFERVRGAMGTIQ